jgi:hypothetical protein
VLPSWTLSVAVVESSSIWFWLRDESSRRRDQTFHEVGSMTQILRFWALGGKFFRGSLLKLCRPLVRPPTRIHRPF